MILKCLLLGAALVTAAAGSGGAETKMGEGKRIVFLGDSLTAGYGVLPSESFPGLIEATIREKGLGFTVVNAGVSGNTSAQGLERAPDAFRDGVDVLVLFLGANDGLRHLSVAALRRNLEKIMALARRRNPRVHIFQLDMRMPAEWGAYSTEFNQMYPNLALRQRTTELPWVMEGIIGQLDMTLADGLHPNPKGYQLMAERVWKGLEPILKKAAADPPAKP